MLKGLKFAIILDHFARDLLQRTLKNNGNKKIMENFLLLLSTITSKSGDAPRLSKTVDENLNTINGYPRVKSFHFYTCIYHDIHTFLKKEVFRPDRSNFCIVLGELNELGEAIEESGGYHNRLKKEGIDKQTGKRQDPVIRDRDGNQIVIDLDGVEVDSFDPLDPVPAIKKWLAENKIDCDVTWQITSSQKLNTNKIRWRLYFEADEEYTLAYRQDYAQSLGGDRSVYTCNQIIYTAPPVIEGGKSDPIPVRTGFIKGKRRTLPIPNVSGQTERGPGTSDIDQHKNHFGKFVFDYKALDRGELPDFVLAGAAGCYRTYFRDLSMGLMTRWQGDKRRIVKFIDELSAKVKSRANDHNIQNIKEYVNDAHRIWQKEQEELKNSDNGLITGSELRISEQEKEVNVPDFPEDLLLKWPEPWPMIWKNFKKVPRDLSEPLLLPTVLALNAYLLRCNFVTEFKRRPNFFFLNLTPSTGNKDVNSKNVIRSLAELFTNTGKANSLFSGIINTESNITADVTFLQSFNEDNELFWINTEATRIFQQLSNPSNVSSVDALSDKIIEVVDGYEITGKAKASGKVKTIANPNCQLLFYAQPETIEKHITSEMVDRGFFGRSLITVVPELKKSPLFVRNKAESISLLDHDFVDFYSSDQFNLSGFSSSEPAILKIDDKGFEKLSKWSEEYVDPIREQNDECAKVLGRIGQTAEQLYTLILGVCQLYDMHKKEKIRESFDVSVMLPILEYWTDSKVYAVEHLVDSGGDDITEEVEKVFNALLAGNLQSSTANYEQIIKDENVVPRADLKKILKKRKKIKHAAKNSKIPIDNKIDQAIESFLKNDILVSREVSSKFSSRKVKCLGKWRDA